MSLSNLNNRHLEESKVAQVNNTLTALEQALDSIVINLNTEDRQKYGSINEQNKLFVNRVYDFHKNQPALRTPQVDWEEFDRDYTSRKNISNFIDRLERILQNLKNAKILYDYDNYQDSLVDYAFTNYMAGTSAAGFEAKQSELKQFFAKSKKTIKSEKPAS